MFKANPIFYNLLLICLFMGCKSKDTSITYESENLKIRSISENTYIHISYLETATVGTVSCNGMVYIDDQEAIIFDSPTTNRATEELIEWIRETQKAKIKGVVYNHFHEDCTGGQVIFQKEDLPIYAHQKTFERLSKPEGLYVFRNPLYLKVGSEEIVGRYIGEAHTRDNIVCYVPSEELIFGGCMVKSIGAKKGNLTDANVGQWSTTVEKIKTEYPNVKTIVPGHGKPGGVELLDYTIELFKTH